MAFEYFKMNDMLLTDLNVLSSSVLSYGFRDTNPLRSTTNIRVTNYRNTVIPYNWSTKLVGLVEYKSDSDSIIDSSWLNDPSSKAYIDLDVTWSKDKDGITPKLFIDGYKGLTAPATWDQFSYAYQNSRTSAFEILTGVRNVSQGVFLEYRNFDVTSIVREIAEQSASTYFNRLYFFVTASPFQSLPVAKKQDAPEEKHFVYFRPQGDESTSHENRYSLKMDTPQSRIPLEIDSCQSSMEAGRGNNVKGLGDEVLWVSPETQRDSLFGTNFQYSITSRHQFESDVTNLPSHYDSDGYLKFGDEYPQYGVGGYLNTNQEGKDEPPIPLQDHQGGITFSVWLRAQESPTFTYYSPWRQYSVFGNGASTKGIEFSFSGPNETSRTFNSITGEYFIRYDYTFNWRMNDKVYSVVLKNSSNSFIQPRALNISDWNHYCITVTRGSSSYTTRLDVTNYEGDEVYSGSMLPLVSYLPSSESISNLSQNSIGKINANSNRNFRGDIKDLRLFDRKVSNREKDRLAISPGIQGGIISADLQDVSVSSQVSSVNVILPTIISDDVESQSQCEQVYLKPPMTTDSAESVSENSTSDVRSVLPAEDLDIASQAEGVQLGPFSYGLSLDSSESLPQCEVVNIGLDGALEFTGSESRSESSAFNIDANLVRAGVRGAPVGPDVNASGDSTENAWFCPTINSDMAALAVGAISDDLSHNDYDAELVSDESNSSGSLLVDQAGSGGSKAFRVGQGNGRIELPQFVHNGYFGSGASDTVFENWTVSLWWKPDADSQGGQFFRSRHEYRINSVNNTFETGGLRLFISYQPAAGITPAHVKFGTPDIDGSSTVSVKGNVVPGQWNHIVASASERPRSGGMPANSGEINLYVNGVLSESKIAYASDSSYDDLRSTALISAGFNSTEEGTSIGDPEDNGDPSGLVDDIRSYSQALGFEHIRWLYRGDDSGGRGVIGEPFFPYDLESLTQASSIQISADANLDSVISRSQVSLVDVVASKEASTQSVQSLSQNSETDLLVRNFAADRDPLIIGDRMSQSKERAVVEFSIANITTRFPVYLQIEVEAVNNDFLATAGRWLSDWPTNYTELQNGIVDSLSRSDFIPSVGEMRIDVTAMIVDAKAAGDSLIAICLLEQPNFSNNYYEVDNSSAGKPKLSFSTITSISVDDVQSSSQCQDVDVDLNLAVDSLQSASLASNVNVQSDTLAIPGTEVISEFEPIDGLSISGSIQLQSAQSSSQCSQVDVQPDFLTFGYNKSFVLDYPPTASDMKPFFQNGGWSYDADTPNGIRHSDDSDIVGPSLVVRVNIREEGVLAAEWSIMRKRGVEGTFRPRNRSVEIKQRLPGETSLSDLATISDSDFEDKKITIPAGSYYLYFTPVSIGEPTSSIFLERVRLSLTPLVIDNAQSSSQCSAINISVDLLVDSSQTQSECEQPVVKRSDYVLEGSFEQNDEGWTYG